MSLVASPRAAAVVIACLSTLLASVPATAAKIEPWRRIDVAALDGLGPMPLYSVSAQRRAGVLVDDPRMRPGDALLNPVAVDPDVAGDGFGGGLPLGVVGYVVTSAIVQGRWETARDSAREVVLASDGGGDWSAAIEQLHAAVLRGLAQALGDSEQASALGLEPKALIVADPCAGQDPCALVLSQWGLTDDARHFELQLRLMLWSPKLRDSGESRDDEPDFANLLVFRSGPLEVDRPKSPSDRQALERAALRIHDGLGIPQLVATANASRDAEAEQARSRAARLLNDHRQRLRDARAARWNDRSRRLGRAILWGVDAAAAMRESLAAATGLVPLLIASELSKAVQQSKTGDSFPARRRLKTAQTIAHDSGIDLAVLNDGTLLIAPEGHEPESFGQAVVQAPPPQLPVAPVENPATATTEVQ